MTNDKFNNLYFGAKEGVFIKLETEKQIEKIKGVEHVQSLVTTNNGIINAGTDNGNIYKSIGYDFNREESLVETAPIIALNFTSDDIFFAMLANGKNFYKKATATRFIKFKKIMIENDNTINTFVYNKENKLFYVGANKGYLWKNDFNVDFKKLPTIFDQKVISLISSNDGIIYAGSNESLYFSN